jgi:phage terminase large subunit-like protein
MQREAIRDPRKQATFQTKHLNLWVASASPWLPMQLWKAAGDKSLKLEQFAGEAAGKASTSRTSRTSRRAARCSDAWSMRARALVFFWRTTCRKRGSRSPRTSITRAGTRQGWLTATPGSMIDQDLIEKRHHR